jgi:hypothetical protein
LSASFAANGRRDWLACRDPFFLADTSQRRRSSSQAGRAGRLKQRQVIEFVIIIVNYCKSRDLGMHAQPNQNLIPARPFRHVGYDIIVGNPPIAGR